jgi:hypothetical protein
VQFRAGLAALLLAPAVFAMNMEELAQPLELHFGGDIGGGKRFGDSSAPSAFQLGVVATMIHGAFAFIDAAATDATVKIVFRTSGKG